MAKNYEEVAMDVIREDWEFRKSQHNASSIKKELRE